MTSTKFLNVFFKQLKQAFYFRCSYLKYLNNIQKKRQHLNPATSWYAGVSSYMNIFATMWFPKDCWSEKWTENMKNHSSKIFGSKNFERPSEDPVDYKKVCPVVRIEGRCAAFSQSCCLALFGDTFPAPTSRYGVIQCPGSPESGKVEKCNKIQRRCFIILADYQSICWNTRQTLCFSQSTFHIVTLLPTACHDYLFGPCSKSFHVYFLQWPTTVP